MRPVLQLLHPGLLEGRAVATAGPARTAFAEALEALGAGLRPLEADLADEEATSQAAGAAGPVDALVVDAAALFAAAARDDELAPLRAAADRSWSAARAVANAGWIEQDGGKLVLVAPRPGEGPHAGAARDALENMARTLSIEWSRYGIRSTTITPGAATGDGDLASVVAYLVSPAGDYFSGTRLDLR